MGQCCTAGSRLFAHKRVFDRLMEGIASEAGKISMGPGLNLVQGLTMPLLLRRLHLVRHEHGGLTGPNNSGNTSPGQQ